MREQWSKLRAGWQRLQARLEELFEKYGRVAVGIHFTLLGLTVFGFWMAIRSGFEVSSTAGGAGTLGAAYLASRATLPVRAVITLAITPWAAKQWARWRGKDGG